MSYLNLMAMLCRNIKRITEKEKLWDSDLTGALVKFNIEASYLTSSKFIFCSSAHSCVNRLLNVYGL